MALDVHFTLRPSVATWHTRLRKPAEQAAATQGAEHIFKNETEEAGGCALVPASSSSASPFIQDQIVLMGGETAKRPVNLATAMELASSQALTHRQSAKLGLRPSVGTWMLRLPKFQSVSNQPTLDLQHREPVLTRANFAKLVIVEPNVFTSSVPLLLQPSVATWLMPYYRVQSARIGSALASEQEPLKMQATGSSSSSSYSRAVLAQAAAAPLAKAAAAAGLAEAEAQASRTSQLAQADAVHILEGGQKMDFASIANLQTGRPSLEAAPQVSAKPVPSTTDESGRLLPVPLVQSNDLKEAPSQPDPVTPSRPSTKQDESNCPETPPSTGPVITDTGSDVASRCNGCSRLPLPTHCGSRNHSGDSRSPLLSNIQRSPFGSGSNGDFPRSSEQLFRRRPMLPPLERRKVGPHRLRARDRWNIQELRLCDVLARSPDLSEGAEESDLAHIVTELYGQEQDPAELRWTYKLATRGKQRCVSVGELHYALRAQYARHHLPQATMRMLATTSVGAKGTVERESLQRLMEDLNDGYTVSAAEVNAVLDEADALSEGLGSGCSGRGALLWGLGAWYLNIDRLDSPWSVQLQACYGRWLPENEYHLEVLARLQKAMKGLRSSSRDEYGFEEPLGSSQKVCALMTVVCLALALLAPFVFFATFVVLGGEHGSDRCSKDLDGLMTWFGVLGLATLVVGCFDGHISSDSNETLTASFKASRVSVTLKLVLFAMPWLGASWAFHLSPQDQQTCGSFLSGASALIWTALIIAELLSGFIFLWLLASFAEHEMCLRESPGLSGLSEEGLSQGTPRRLRRGDFFQVLTNNDAQDP